MNCSLQMPVTFRSPCFFHSHFMTLDQAKDSITTSVELGERAAVGSPAEGAEQREEIRIHSWWKGEGHMAGCRGLFLCLCWELPAQLWFLTGLFDGWYFWRTRKQVWEVSQVTNKYINLGHFPSSQTWQCGCYNDSTHRLPREAVPVSAPSSMPMGLRLPRFSP